MAGSSAWWDGSMPKFSERSVDDHEWISLESWSWFSGLMLQGDSGEAALSFSDIAYDRDCTPSLSSILTRVVSLPSIIQTKMMPIREKNKL